MDMKMKVDTDAACAAFDQLGTNGPRLVELAFFNAARTAAAQSNSKKPSGIPAVEVHNLTEGDTIALFIGPADIPKYGHDADGDNKRVAWWTSRGTRNQRPQRWFKKVSRAKRDTAIEAALLRAAARAGFNTKVGISG